MNYQVKTRSPEELLHLCKSFLLNEYNVDLPELTLKINNRLSRTLGRYIVTPNMFNDRIELSGKLIRHGSDQEVISVLKHECIHCAMYRLDRPFDDGHEEFENELIKHDSHSTGSIMLIPIDVESFDGDKELEELVRRVVKESMESMFKKISKELSNN